MLVWYWKKIIPTNYIKWAEGRQNRTSRAYQNWELQLLRMQWSETIAKSIDRANAELVLEASYSVREWCHMWFGRCRNRISHRGIDSEVKYHRRWCCGLHMQNSPTLAYRNNKARSSIFLRTEMKRPVESLHEQRNGISETIDSIQIDMVIFRDKPSFRLPRTRARSGLT